MTTQTPHRRDLPPAIPVARHQVAALCHRRGPRGGRQVLLITSRDTGRWVLPKGWPIEGLDAPGSARQEAWEEAGVAGGEISDRPIGSYRYDKGLDDGTSVPCEVEVFDYAVSAMAAAFPEATERELRWVSPAEAAEMVDEPALRRLIRAFPGSR